MVTIEQVKDHFKNAKEVRCLVFGDEFYITNYEIYESERVFTAGNSGFSRYRIFDKDINKFAKIISYKEEPKTDSIVESVINQFKERSKVGIEKYGTTLDRKDLTTLEWIEHAKQEAMDFILYLEKLKREYDK